MKSIGIIANPDNVQAGSLISYLGDYLANNGIAIWCEKDSFKALNSTDLLLVLGGDGTMLRAFRNYGHLQIPFLCINFGTIGFLSSLEPAELPEYLDFIITGGYQLDERSVLRLSIRKKGQDPVSLYAVNDVVVKAINLHVSRQILRVDDIELYTYCGDGLVIATSTGSTAYALSAGGAIVDPSIDCMLVRPICSRTESAKTILFSLDRNLEVMSKDRRPCAIFVDGIESGQLNEGDFIVIGRADIKARFVLLNPDRYFNLLRNKAWYCGKNY